MAVSYHGQVAQLLHAHGFGPGRSILREAVLEGGWRQCPYCWYAGARMSLRGHMQKAHPVDALTERQVQSELAELEAAGHQGMASTREIQLLARA